MHFFHIILHNSCIIICHTYTRSQFMYYFFFQAEKFQLNIHQSKNHHYHPINLEFCVWLKNQEIIKQQKPFYCFIYLLLFLCDLKETVHRGGRNLIFFILKEIKHNTQIPSPLIYSYIPNTKQCWEILLKLLDWLSTLKVSDLNKY